MMRACEGCMMRDASVCAVAEWTTSWLISLLLDFSTILRKGKALSCDIDEDKDECWISI